MAKEIFQFEAVYGVFAPHRLHMRLNGSLFDYDVDDALPLSMSTIVHEHMHLFQTLFTGYGHIAWDSHRQLTSYVVSEWVKEHTSLGEKRFLPLAHYANENPSRLTWALILDSTIKESIISGMARHWHSNPGATLKKMGLKLTPHEWKANPTIKVNGEVHVLQTKEIIEGHAQFVENAFLENAYNYPKSILWNHDEIPKIYWVALDWFIETCGENRYFEFPFICDLALQTSWDPVIPTTEEEWRASNPSWRFIHLSKTLCEMRGLSLGSVEEVKEKYSFFSETLLEACGYKSLDKVLLERLNAFNRKDELLPSRSVYEIRNGIST